MKDIPIPNWIPLTLVAAFAFVVWRAPLPEGELAWHIGVAIAVFLVCVSQIEPGATKLVTAMALWLGADVTLAYFTMLIGFFGPLALGIHKRGGISDNDRFPILPFAAPAFALTLAYAPIWPHALDALRVTPTIKQSTETPPKRLPPRTHPLPSRAQATR